MEKGQRTLNGVPPPPGPRVNGESTHHERPRSEDNKASISVIMNPSDSQNTQMVDRTVENHASHQDDDVEMAD